MRLRFNISAHIHPSLENFRGLGGARRMRLCERERKRGTEWRKSISTFRKG
jgi:hypothetical protein